MTGENEAATTMPDLTSNEVAVPIWKQCVNALRRVSRVAKLKEKMRPRCSKVFASAWKPPNVGVRKSVQINVRNQKTPNQIQRHAVLSQKILNPRTKMRTVAPKPPKAVAAAAHKVVEAAAAHKAASLPHANKPKKHGPSALRNIKPNAPKPPKAVAAAAHKAVAAEAHKVVEAAAAHSNGAPRVMTFAKPLPSASSNLPNPAKK